MEKIKNFLMVILFYLTLGIEAENKSQNCMDSMKRPGNCVPTSGCPYIIEEYYDQTRRTPEGIDFHTFLTQSLCGFDGFRFLICCPIRTNYDGQQQVSQSVPWNDQSSSSLFHFAPLGQPKPSPEPNLNTMPATTAPPSQVTTSTLEPLIIAPVPGDQPIMTSPFMPTNVNVLNPSPPRDQLPFTIPPLRSIKSMDPQTRGCGVTNVFTNRVVGGTEARKGAYPWMAALGYNEATQPNVLKFLCSGSLISKDYVLTVAHCLNPSLILVRLGAHDLSKSEANAVNVKIKRQIIHERFDLKTISNDIALLQLSAPVSFTEFISPICLPEDIKFMQQNFVGNNPFIAGWGTVQFQGAQSNALRDAQVPILETSSCLANYSTRFRAVESKEMLICAGSYISDACQGDSGGPLMMPQLDESIYRYHVIGLVSYGFECARSGFPGVYTRVAAYMPWIKMNMM